MLKHVNVDVLRFHFITFDKQLVLVSFHWNWTNYVLARVYNKIDFQKF